MFILALLLLSLLATTHVAVRAATVPALARRWPRRRILATFAGLWVAMVVTDLLGHGASFFGAGFLALAGMTLLGLLFLALASLLAVDLATGFGLWARALAPRLRGWALLGSLGLAAVASVQGLRAPEVVDYEVRLKALPPVRDGLVVVTLSDLHLGAILGPDWLAARVAQVRALRPDLVLLLGDVFEGHGRPDPRCVAQLRDLQPPLGVWGVDGNHEHYGLLGSPLDEAGVHVLRDALAVPIPGLVLAGRADRGRRTGGGVWEIPRDRPPGALVLLSHRPDHPELAARAGAGLMLSGHTHGGQMWPFGWVVRGAYPSLAGRTSIDGMPLIVSRGAGTWGPRMRLWQRGEISLIRLRSGSDP